jgi:hypothetical protein
MRALLLLNAALAFAAAGLRVDLAVYGSTPAGIAAAVVAARQGHRVALIEPTAHVGGLLTGGLSYTDFRTQESVTGFFREYMNRVLAYYERKYGRDSQQARDCFLGAHAEPHVSSKILGEMMAEQKTLSLHTEWRLEAVSSQGRPANRRFLDGAIFRGAHGVERVAARFWIDATYEGDFAAAANVPYRLGRESTREYGERLAGVIYFDQGKILPGSTGDGDDSVQCANVRVIMTSNPKLRLDVPKPKGYQRAEFAHLAPLFASGRIREVYSEDHSGILRLQRITNYKADMNDIKQAPIRLALPGEMQEWPGGGAEERQRILERHRDYAMGLLYFLQNDSELPEAIRAKAKEWGLAKDEFPESGHMPPALYVREARRIEGRYTFTEHDTQPAANSVRTRVQSDAIAIGDYSLNSHGNHRQGPLYPRLVEGDFAFSTTPFQIPFGTLAPKNIDNLLVPVAISASHVGYSALRLEPTWTAMGHAAGIAGSLYLRHGKVEVSKVQTLLHEQGQATIYASDVGPGHPRFRLVQWAGLQGLLSGIVDPATAELAPLRKRHGLQYAHAFPLHEVGLEQNLDERLRKLWRKQLPCAAGAAGKTRGDFLEEAFAKCAH